MNDTVKKIDTAFINGIVLTMNGRDEVACGVGISGNAIGFVGDSQVLEQMVSQDTRVIDLEGRTLMPGFIDTHFHPILKGLLGDDEEAAIINTSFENCPSIQDILALVRKAARRKGPSAWISMMGYDQNRILEKRHITLEELDEAAPDNPVQCMRTCGHVCVYNSRALEKISVFSAADAGRYPENEILVEQGKLTGMVKDSTHFLLWHMVPYTEEEQVQAAMNSNALLLENGVTSVHDAGEFSGPSYRIMETLCSARIFKPRVYMLIHNVFGKEFAMKDNEAFLADGFITGIGDEFYRYGSLKFMIDGGTSGPSCATRSPYSHDPGLPGILAWEREETRSYIEKLNDAGCQVTAHAVGDLAVEYMVEGYEHAFLSNPGHGRRHRIEHCALVDEDLLARMGKMNICPSCNPGFIAWNGSNYTRYYGERMKWFMALRSMLEKGIRVSIGSDSPSGPASPLVILDAAVNRIDRTTGEQTDRTQAVSIREALRLFTINGAYSSFEEDRKGSIEEGKLADLVVLSENLSTLEPKDILKVHVEMTMIDGVIEYERKYHKG